MDDPKLDTLGQNENASPIPDTAANPSHIVETASSPKVSASSVKPPIKDSPWIVYATTVVTLFSFALNAYLLYDKLVQRSIEQPPPLLGRIQMTVLKATVLEAVAAKQPSLISLFPSPGIVETDLWKQESKTTVPLSRPEKEARRFRFLVIRNPSTSLTYDHIRLTIDSQSLATVDTLPPASTRLVLLNRDSQDSRIDALYRISGSSRDQSTMLPARVGNEVVMLVDMSMTEINSLASSDDRVRMLIGATNPSVSESQDNR